MDILTSLLTSALRPEPDYRLPVPALLVHGQRDQNGDITTSMRVWAEREPLARYAVIPHAGHASNLDNPDHFTDLLTALIDEVAHPAGNLDSPDFLESTESVEAQPNAVPAIRHPRMAPDTGGHPQALPRPRRRRHRRPRQPLLPAAPDLSHTCRPLPIRGQTPRPNAGRRTAATITARRAVTDVEHEENS